ncbi:MAG: DUF4139 domain-containing protein [Terriglobales bacterium]
MRFLAALVLTCSVTALAQTPPAPALTIYNQDFAVVRQQVRLNLESGTTNVRYDGITAQLEPDSVVLRDPTGKRALQILEQNYEGDPVSEPALLKLFAGKTIDFEVTRGATTEVVQGRIVRPGAPMPRYVRGPQQVQPCYPAYPGCEPQTPLIEVNGKLEFGLPGKPLFPALPQDTNLNPTIDWQLRSDHPGPLEAELSYITGGMTWEADYNVIAPASGNTLDLVGWVTMDNRSGKTFENAHVQLMAGDVNKIQPGGQIRDRLQVMNGGMGGGIGAPPVTEKPFDEYHLYSLQRPTTLREGETKQVEFVRATGITAKRVYIYDGSRIDPARLQNQNWEYLRFQRDLGVGNNTKVWVMQEFKNTEQNHLGMPLPKGRLRFYRLDDAGSLQFIGENTIDHTPKDETIRVYTGNAFDMVGERRRTNFRSDQGQSTVDESFEIKVRNHKKEPVDVTIVEHLYRGSGWDITSSSAKWDKKDSNTIEFPVTIPADGEQTVIYSVHYAW